MAIEARGSMKRHVIELGEGIASLAETYGHAPDVIWQHPENAELRELRADPNILLPGDVVTIPDRTPGLQECAIDQRHLFKRRGVPARLAIQIRRNGKVKKSEAFRIEGPGVLIEGSTDGDGWIREYLPNRTRWVELTVLGRTRRMAIGRAYPLDMVEGVKTRLRNLGIYNGEIDASEDEELRRALRQFQRAHELEATGERDATTVGKLGEVHGS